MTARKTHKAESTPTAEKREDTTDTSVTELAQVTGDTSKETLKQMAGVSDTQYKPDEKPEAEASTQQKDALETLELNKKDEQPAAQPDFNPHVMGPGSDIA